MNCNLWLNKILIWLGRKNYVKIQLRKDLQNKKATKYSSQLLLDNKAFWKWHKIITLNGKHNSPPHTHTEIYKSNCFYKTIIKLPNGIFLNWHTSLHIRRVIRQKAILMCLYKQKDKTFIGKPSLNKICLIYAVTCFSPSSVLKLQYFKSLYFSPVKYTF